jgi:hypothetical protein
LPIVSPVAGKITYFMTGKDIEKEYTYSRAEGLAP